MLMEWILRRNSRGLCTLQAPGSHRLDIAAQFPHLSQLNCRLLQFRHQDVAQFLLRGDFPQQFGLAGNEEVNQLLLKMLYVLEGNRVQISVLYNPNSGYFDLDRDGAVLGLVENLGDVLTA